MIYCCEDCHTIVDISSQCNCENCGNDKVYDSVGWFKVCRVDKNLMRFDSLKIKDNTIIFYRYGIISSVFSLDTYYCRFKNFNE